MAWIQARFIGGIIGAAHSPTQTAMADRCRYFQDADACTENYPAATTVVDAGGRRSKQRLREPRAGVISSIAAIATDRAGAQEVLAKVKTVSTAAYVRECRPKNGSRISLGIPAIDPSIEAVPPNTVNWTDEDRVSTIIKLPEDGFLWIRKMYQPAPEDPREGRRTSVQFFRTDPHKSIQLSADCTDLKCLSEGGPHCAQLRTRDGSGKLAARDERLRRKFGEGVDDRCALPESGIHFKVGAKVRQRGG